ncbi:hypothetical protein [Streptomyces sp. NPDC047869]|uniref:hypothetical protein n=1 Tax=Streptomyces sp. NPDC047869 TaxID=3154709 RepID=UPI0034554C9A
MLNSLENSDGSSAHFDWSEFHSNDGSGFGGGKVSSAQVKENVRQGAHAGVQVVAGHGAA